MAAKNNDPAFLFYSKDFYEGTRMMLPDERACYIDLMIYQHQHGCIPLDLKRVLLYCNGINEATLKATLEAKFIATLDGYINLKLETVMLERSEFSNKQSINGTVGQFFKKAKALLPKKDYMTLRELLSDNTNNQIFELIGGKEIDKAMLVAMLEALLKHLEDANGDEDKDLSKDKFDYSFFGNYTDMMIEWVEYKKSIKDSYKSQKSLVACFENLKKLSNDNVTTAKDIIMQSMANNWKGLFELKNKPKSALIGVGEFINADGNRTYGTSGVIVPTDAPPRPSNQHIWSKNEAKWKIQ